MRKRTTTLALSAMAFLAICSHSTAANAQTESAGRYTMTPINGGFVRLDSQTGEMSVCRERDGQLTCELIEDQAKARREELAELRKENERLKEEVRRLDLILNMPGQNEAPQTQPNTPGFTLPTEEQVDEALDYFENILRNLKERLERLEKDKEPATEPEPRQL